MSRYAGLAGADTQLAPVGAPPPAYASGVAYTQLRLVPLTLMAPRGAEAVNLDEVFRHELAHVALEDALGGQSVPLWFNEGLAMHESGELIAQRMKTLWSATLSGTLHPLADLDKRFPADPFQVQIAYAQSADFVRFMLRDSDRARFHAMISRVRSGQPFDRAVRDAYGSDLRKLEFQWRSDLEHRYSVIPIITGGTALWVLIVGGLPRLGHDPFTWLVAALSRRYDADPADPPPHPASAPPTTPGGTQHA